MFAKVFTQILDSSIAEDYLVRHVFEDFLKLANIDGVVDMTVEAIVRRTNVPGEVVRRAIDKLESPDPTSRNQDEGGRRIVRIDANRTWGWRIVSYKKYRDIRSESDHRRALTPTVSTGYIYFLRGVSEDSHIKIGFSTNPWARAKELNTGSHEEQILIGHIRGNQDDEADWHMRFEHLRKNGEWFSPAEELLDAILDVCPSSNDVVLRISKQRKKQKQTQKEEYPPEEETGFDVFWKAYPRKTGKGAAEKSFSKIRGVELKTILDAIEAQKKSYDWLKDGGQFIPHPATWLNQKRWEDEVFTASTQPVPPQRPIPVYELRRQRDTLVDQIRVHPGNPGSAANPRCTAALKEEYIQMKARRKQLDEQIAAAEKIASQGT